MLFYSPQTSLNVHIYFLLKIIYLYLGLNFKDVYNIVDQCSCELTNTYLFREYIASISLESNLVFVPCIKTVLAIIIHYRANHIPVSHVSRCKLVPRISLCQRINILVHTKDILRVSACHNVSIMTCVINVRHSVTPWVTIFDRTNLYIFPVRTFILVCMSIFPSPV